MADRRTSSGKPRGPEPHHVKFACDFAQRWLEEMGFDLLASDEWMLEFHQRLAVQLAAFERAVRLDARKPLRAVKRYHKITESEIRSYLRAGYGD